MLPSPGALAVAPLSTPIPARPPPPHSQPRRVVAVEALQAQRVLAAIKEGASFRTRPAPRARRGRSGRVVPATTALKMSGAIYLAREAQPPRARTSHLR